jgi:peptidoglycan hydrolase-like protein with peptidoglycan-binding domain
LRDLEGVMAYKSFAISSGHGKYIRGASGYLDEVNEARRVVDRVAELLRGAGVPVKTFHDDVSHSQSENLNRICNWHNGQSRELDVSVHFNAYQTTSSPMGTECLYVTQSALSGTVAMMIAEAGEFKNRGPKKRTDLAFLNNTNKPAILVETCFVDSKEDARLYNENFDDICLALAEAITSKSIAPGPTPPDPSPEPEPPPKPDERPVIGKGDDGPYVVAVQTTLGIIPADGDFGPTTDGGVKGFQAAAGLTADGIVGPKTWEALDELAAAKAAGNDVLPQEQINEIIRIADASAIARYSWRDRGTMPKGYTAGIALCFALAATALARDNPTAAVVAQADRNDTDKDALSFYASKFRDLGMDNSEDGIDTLRHLFVMILGLGARESSGKYCEGRDMSADNCTAETAEAGMFQTSWNIRSCNSRIPPLLQRYWANPNGFLPAFQNGAKPDSNDLGNYGSGDGAKYQFLSKFAPAFHCFVTAIGMRYLRQHWGPINRSEVELRREANEMLLEVQNYLSEDAAEMVMKEAV